nr:hypothetical protein [Parabacteroides distasonis]
MKFENEYWDHFKGETWKREINVRDFIQSNYTPYEGDDSFLVASSEKTRKVWNKLTEMFKVEREKALEPILSRNIIKSQIIDNHILSKV